MKYAIANGSPCIDKGDPNSSVIDDINGVSRPQDGDGDDVAICDMGAYEYRMPISQHAPLATNATNLSTSGFTANWNAASGADSYRLDVSTVNDFSSYVTGYENLTVNETSQSVTGLTSGTTYYYRVRAVNIYGTSDNSNIISVSTNTTVTINKTGTGTGTLSQATQTVNYGSNLTVTATPDTSSYFSGWSGDVTGRGDAVLTNITSDKQISANFILRVGEIGDIDHDQSVNLGDAIIGLKILIGIDLMVDIYIENEANMDGKIGMEDVIYILTNIASIR